MSDPSKSKTCPVCGNSDPCPTTHGCCDICYINPASLGELPARLRIAAMVFNNIRDLNVANLTWITEKAPRVALDAADALIARHNADVIVKQEPDDE